MTKAWEGSGVGLGRLRGLLSGLPPTVTHWSDLPCIEWTGNRILSGYGNLWANGKTRSASRLAYGMFFARDLNGHACHCCDNPGCVNPHHLFDGSQSENIKDAYRKGRIPTGAESAAARNAKTQPAPVFALRDEGLSALKIAAKLGISPSYVTRILLGQRRQSASQH